MSVPNPRKKDLLERIGALLADTQDLDFSIPDESDTFSIQDDVFRVVRSLMRRTADLMREIMDCYDVEASVDGSSEIEASDDESFLKEIGAQIASQMAVEEVSGLAWVSRGQLLDMMADLDRALELGQTWKVASLADSGLRRAGRALIALESAMRECEGLPAEYRQWQDLDDSLEVRHLYGEFRRGILADGGEDPDTPPQGQALVALLKSAAERIARLRHQEIYPYLRIDDRLQIRRLQQRVGAWLDSPGRSDESGARTWSDLVAFARLLGEVNRRQEIREHDRLAVNGVYRRFFESGEPPARIGAEELALLEPLLGLEDELDEIVLHPDRHTGGDLRSPLERLRRELGQPFVSPSPEADFLAPVET